MEKNKLQIIIGSLCLSVGALLRAITVVHRDALDFFVGLLIGVGFTLVITGFVKIRNTKSA
jgi:hypothetical protein